MDNIKEFILKVTSAWVGIGVFLISLNSIGIITIPEFLLNLFTEEIANSLNSMFDAVFVAINSVIIFYQLIRAKLGLEVTTGATGLKLLNVGGKRSFAINPFKIVH